MGRIRKPTATAISHVRSKNSPPAPKPRACDECKGQKIYCSKTLPKCERCQAKSLECVYAKPKKILVNEDKLRLVKAKLKRYEEIFQALPADVVNSLPSNLRPLISLSEVRADEAGGGSDDDDSSDGDEAEGSLCEQFKQMGIYLRASRGSADNFFQIASKLSGLRNGDDNGSHNGSLEQTPVFYDPGMLPRCRPARGQHISLPPVDIARQYFFAQHMYIGTIFAFSDPHSFERQLSDAYEAPPNINDSQSCLAYAKILMILALGRLYSVNRQGGESASVSSSSSSSTVAAHAGDAGDHPPGFQYFAHALMLLPDVHEPGSLLAVETLAYVGYFLQNMNRRDAAFLYIGLALRMAISLGLHQEAGPSVISAKLSEAEREHRRRVWWSIYSLDRILSLKSGNPISILDEDIGVRMPTRLPGEAADSHVVVLRCYTELSRILGEITTLIYRRASTTFTATTTAATPPSGPALVATVHAILQSLTRWEEALPRALRLDPERGKLSRESISMYLHYYQCINMTARPLLFHVVQQRIAAIRDAQKSSASSAPPASSISFALATAAKENDWRAGLSKKTVAVIHACLSAARNAILVMSKAADHNMVATYGYMDGEHAFSAAIVLALAYIAFPTSPATTEAMSKGLALLRRMGELGNGYVAARYEQLARLGMMLSNPATGSSNIALVEHPLLSGQGNSRTESYMPTYGLDSQPKQIQEEKQQQYFQQERQGQVLPFSPMPDYLTMGAGDVGAVGLDKEYFDLYVMNLADIDTVGLVLDTDVPEPDSLPVEEADSTLWTNAFANPGLDIDQLMPEPDVSEMEYFCT